MKYHKVYFCPISLNYKLLPSNNPYFIFVKSKHSHLTTTWHSSQSNRILLSLLFQLKKEFKDVINYSWLPDKQLAWYETDVRCLAKSKRLAQVLPALHISLQKYLITLEEVNRFPPAIHEPHDVAKIRKRVLFEIAKELKKVHILD